MEYTFERMSDGMYQVRLKGEFVCYTSVPYAEFVDEKLKENGFDSRQEFLDYCWSEMTK